MKQVVIYPRKYVDGCRAHFLKNMKVELVLEKDVHSYSRRCESQQDLSDSHQFVETGLFFDCNGNGKPKQIIVSTRNERETEENRLAIAEIMAFAPYNDAPYNGAPYIRILLYFN